VISLETLTAELRRRKRSDWSVVERVIRRGTARSGRGLARLDDETRISLALHLDLGRGRGTGEVELEGDRGEDPEAIIAAAEARALATVGPAWATPAPAAPAHVDLADPVLVEIDDGTAANVLAGLPTSSDGEATLEYVTVRLATGGISGRDLAVRWAETRVAVRAVLEGSARTIEIAAEARRLADLRLPERTRVALEQLGERAGASAPPSGTYSVVLHASAHAHDGYGLWRALVAQADAALVRQGLSRYRPGGPIAPRANLVDEPLDVESDGTAPFGILSAPVGDRGEPVRRFAVVARGVAHELAYDQREAALARREPNGGIRNLVVGPGQTALADLLGLGTGPVIEVQRFAWLDLDPRTGLAVGRIAAGALHDAGGRQPIVGGTVRFDAVLALATARRSREQVTEGPVSGPAALRVDGVTITVP